MSPSQPPRLSANFASRSLAAQTVLITGASAGIGRAFAWKLAARGANLVLCARNEQRLTELATDIRTQHPVHIEVAACDLEAKGAAVELGAQLARRGLAIDVLVNNAGFGSAGRFERQGYGHIQTMVQLNCVAVAELTHVLLPAMLERRRGGVINVASVAAFVPTPLMAVYGASKAFVLSFTAALREELRGSGLHVMAVCPGPVPTEFQRRAGYSAVELSNPAVLSAEEVVERALSAYERGQVICVPGIVNRLQTALCSLLPLSWLAAISAKVLRGRGRDL